MKNRCDGFTLAELLIVVAIIGVLVGVAIPIFSQQLERSREATDLANVRATYAEVMAEAMDATASYPISKAVNLKQKQSDWQYYEPAVIAGIIHYRNEGDTKHWKGVPGAGGKCIVSYNPRDEGIVFTWSGGSGGSTESGSTINFKEDVHEALNKTGLKDKYPRATFEIDSRSPESVMVSAVQKHLKSDSLLQHGTWAYLGDTTRPEYKATYLFWTSVNTDTVGTGKTIPVIISKEGGGFYVSESTTATRKTNNGSYVAISDHIPNRFSFTKFTTGRTEYRTLEEAYRAYEKLLKTDPNYTKYEATLPK